MLARAIVEIGREMDFRLASFIGGSKRNAIPREAEAVVFVPAGKVNEMTACMKNFNKVLLAEIGNVEPGLSISTAPAKSESRVFSARETAALLDTLYAMPHGVLKMSADIEGLVETSTNLATVTLDNDTLTIGTSQRSSVETEKYDAVNQVSSVFKLAGFRIEFGDGYPGWKPNMQSFVLKQTCSTYKQLFGSDPEIKAIHAGLECGLIGEAYPEMDMISFGPTIEGAHSPDERLHIPTTAKFWTLLTTLLQNIAK
jgi:dipeptidase D